MQTIFYAIAAWLTLVMSLISGARATREGFETSLVLFGVAVCFGLMAVVRHVWADKL